MKRVQSKKEIFTKFRPKRLGDKCSWYLPLELTENIGLPLLGFLKNFLAEDRIKSCKLDFQQVEWADPVPLLIILLILAESKLSKEQIEVNLGSTDITKSTDKKRIFLKFLSQQGFLRCFNDFAIIRSESKISHDFEKLRKRLSTEPQNTHFINADCIMAKILPAENFKDDKSGLQKIVENIVKEAKEYTIKTQFAIEPQSRDILFQKIRKLLYELLLNISEHSHLDEKCLFAGVYARFRGPKPPVESDSIPWNDLFQKTSIIHGQKNFRPNPYSEWLELFICDIGIGLTSRIKEWKIPSNSKVAKDLKIAANSENPLQSIMHRLFRNALSRHHRHDVDRTAVTGLQHLGHMLSIGNDYCRLYTQDGCWVGDHLPWKQGADYSRTDIRNPKKQSPYYNLKPISGTIYAFSIQPNNKNLTYDDDFWFLPNASGKKQIIDALKNETVYNPQFKFLAFDHFDQNSCLPPNLYEMDKLKSDILFLRPPRIFKKQDISRWLSLVVGNKSEKAQCPSKVFIIAGLTPFQGLTFRELLLEIPSHAQTVLDIYLVSENWAVTCISTTSGQTKFKPIKYKAKEFSNKKTDSLLFNMVDLAIVLREMDSKLFWETGPEIENMPFFNKPVEWPSSKEEKQPKKLKRYLDFPIALTNHNRYKACLNSLRRCLYLFPGCEPVGADNLVTSLIRDAKLGSYSNGFSANNSKLFVGSVAVTSGTLNRTMRDDKSPAVQMLYHDDSKIENDSGAIPALLWIPQSEVVDKTTPPIDKEKLQIPWSRIPNTPYIAPLGEQSISLLRYIRSEDGRLDFNKSYYGCTPEQMYNDFERLSILRMGHWKYTNRHDLMTINMRLAFKFSFLELGDLYDWLLKQFDLLFSTRNQQSPKANLLVYPSHPVTDAILDHIRVDENFKDILPEGGMIPIKFLSIRTVSPLLASHLVADRIRKLVKTKNWETWNGVVFDDGTITGKHQRELRQFLKSLGAEETYSIILLDRTGLPAQEEVFEEFKKRHKRLWRWDMPALGNERSCPLCQGLAISQTFAQNLPSKSRLKIRSKEWYDLWKVRNVELDWHQGGFNSTPIMPPLEITFGVDYQDSEKRVEKQLNFNSSTAAASLLVELTRLTTRSDVAVKKANFLETRHRNAAIEIITSQLLLFFDELKPHEKLKRFKILLSLLWDSQTSNEMTILAGLCVTLADNNILGNLWNYCRNNLIPSTKIGNIDAILATMILRSKYKFESKANFRLKHNPTEEEKYNYIMIGGDIKFPQIIRSFLTAFYQNPEKQKNITIHSTKFRKSVDYLIECDNNDIEKIHSKLRFVKSNISLLQQLASILKTGLYVDIPNTSFRKLNDLIVDFETIQKNDFIMGDQNQRNKIANLSNSLHKLLYKDDAVIIHIGDQLFRKFNNSDDFNRLFVSDLVVQNFRIKWTKILKAKAKYEHNKLAVKRWNPRHNTYIKPVVLCSENQNISELWLFFDSFVQGIIEDTLLNVFHANELIPDYFTKDNYQKGDKRAHLWWRLEMENDFLIFKTINSSKNKEINLKQKINISGFERVGGKIFIDTPKELTENSFLVQTNLMIPLCSNFL